MSGASGQASRTRHLVVRLLTVAPLLALSLAIGTSGSAVAAKVSRGHGQHARHATATTKIIPFSKIDNSACGNLSLNPNSEVAGGNVMGVNLTWNGSVTNSGCTMPENTCPASSSTFNQDNPCNDGYWLVGVFCSTLAAAKVARGDLSDCDVHNAVVLTDSNAGPNNVDANTPPGDTGTSWNTCTTFLNLEGILGPLFGALPFNANCVADNAGTGGWTGNWPLGNASGTASGFAPQTGTSTVFHPGSSVTCPPNNADIAAGATPNTCTFVVFPVNFNFDCYYIPIVGITFCLPNSDLTNDGTNILTKDILSSTYTYVVPPTVTNINPATGSEFGKGLVTITGTGFALGSATTFAFGPGNLATNVDCTSSTSCTATTPSHAIGQVDVVATAFGLPSALNSGDEYNYVSPYPAAGYWLAAAAGGVFAAGQAPSLSLNGSTPSDAVSIASTFDGKGYWVVTSTGDVRTAGDATSFGTLPGLGVKVDDIVGIAPTGDNGGYWLIGRDGGEFAFGDASFHGSLPGIGVHQDNIVGMVSTSDGAGYWIASAVGNVWAFGDAQWVGSLPHLGIHVSNIISIVPSPSRAGYLLAGSDGGTFAFGNGLPFLGSLPADGIHVNDVVGLALTPDHGGYWVAGADGVTYGFGDAQSFAQPVGLKDNLPVVGIAST